MTIVAEVKLLPMRIAADHCSPSRFEVADVTIPVTPLLFDAMSVLRVES